MKKRRVVLQLVGLWLLAFSLVAGWVWLTRELSVSEKSLLLIQGLLLTWLSLWLMRWIKPFTSVIAKYRFVLLAIRVVFIFLLLTGIFWIPTFIPILAFSVTCTATAAAIHTTWVSTKPVIMVRLAPRIAILRARFPRLPIRYGRWITRLRWLLAIVLIVVAVISSLAVADNTSIPHIEWQTTVTAPDVPPSVVSLQHTSDGTLYAGTWSGGVFHLQSEKGMWEPRSAGLHQMRVWSLVQASDRAIYAGIEGGQVLRLPAGSEEWESISTGLSQENVRTLVQTNDGELYAGTYGAGVFRWIEAEKRWVPLGTGLKALVLTLVKADDGTLYAGTWLSGVLRLPVDKEQWEPLNVGLSDMGIMTLLQESDGTLYASTRRKGVFRLPVGKEHWKPFGTGLSDSLTSLIKGKDRTFYAATWGGGVFRLHLDTLQWKPFNTGLNDMKVWLLVQGNDGTLYAGTMTGGVFRLPVGAKEWLPLTTTGLRNIHVTTLKQETDGTIYARTWSGSLFRLNSGKKQWETFNTGLRDSVVTMVKGENGTFYAATSSRGVFRLHTGEEQWKAFRLGLADKDVRTLLQAKDRMLYAGTSGEGIFRLQVGQEKWEPLNTGLSDMYVSNLVQDSNGTIYAGTITKGVFCLQVGKVQWENFGTGLSDKVLRALVWGNDGTFYVGTNEGVFHLPKGAEQWEPFNANLSYKDIQTLLQGKDGTLYAGTAGGGVFFLPPGEARWKQPSNRGLSNTIIRTLLIDKNDGILYAGTAGGGIFHSADGGEHWHPVNTGLTDDLIHALTVDRRNGTLSISLSGGNSLFRSFDGGQSWQNTSTYLPPDGIDSLVTNEPDGGMYAASCPANRLLCSVYSRNEQGEWHEVEHLFSPASIASLFSQDHGYGLLIQRTDDTPICATTGGGPLWAWLVDVLDVQHATLYQKPDGTTSIIIPRGVNIVESELLAMHQPPDVAADDTETKPAYDYEYKMSSPGWLAVRILVWRATAWAEPRLLWFPIAAVLIIGMLLVSIYIKLSRSFGIPVWAFVLAPYRLEKYAQREKLESAWCDWKKEIREALLQYGDVTAEDLSRIPRSFCRYALRRYARTFISSQTIEDFSGYPGRIRLLAGNRLTRWHTAWRTASRSVGTQAGFTTEGRVAVEVMKALLVETLGLNQLAARDFDATRAFQVEAPTLRLNLPPRFPLVFVSDPQPGERTVQMLVDAVDVLRESGFFALVVPLEPLVRQVDVVAELRQAVERSPHVQDFIVLSQQDVLDILIARQPARTLVQCVLRQVDLSVVSPFVTSGPVPSTMFFGRDAEVKRLVELVSSSDFAIVGNRKVGKTSLLQRTKQRLAAIGKTYPLSIDCQTVSDASGFFAAFQEQTGLALPEATQDGFAAAMNALHEAGPIPVLLIDEVDILLTHEKQSGERLVATWRRLAQSGVCRFIFCGSTGLAQRLDDPESSFFNFSQPLPLGYLTAETAHMVLAQPLETLGITLEEAETLLDETYALTSGHPNLVQYVGQGLVDAANRRKERRIVHQDLTELRASANFTDYYLKTVWGVCNPLEKLVTLVMPPAVEQFRLPQLEEALAQHGVQVPDEHLDDALKMLQIYAILQKQERTYQFVPRAFLDILHRTQEVERLIAREKRRLQSGSR